MRSARSIKEFGVVGITKRWHGKKPETNGKQKPNFQRNEFLNILTHVRKN